MPGLIKPAREETLLAMPTASETLPAALSQLVLPPAAQLERKEVGLMAPANWFSKLLALGAPALESASFNWAWVLAIVSPMISRSKLAFFIGVFFSFE